jgi:uncharacterized protein
VQCPRCQNIVLDEIDRNGVTVDRCANCRGIWLDRGELEKLIARASADFEQGSYARAPSPEQRPEYRSDPRHAPHPDREPPSSDRHRYGQKRHRSFWHDLFD